MTLMLLFLLSVVYLNPPVNIKSETELHGAWQSEDGVYIFSDGYFSYTAYTADTFKYTYGGSFSADADRMVLHYEFNSAEDEQVGKDLTVEIKLRKKQLLVDEVKFERIDDGTPGALEGAWLFTNRMQNGELEIPRSQDSPRKTMKILSGTRFQWIAYDTSTGRFMGTGGGTYTTANGKYTENIEFFSRDQSRVGASLEFDYEIKGDDWHHRGLSSRGDPIYEIWSKRKSN